MTFTATGSGDTRAVTQTGTDDTTVENNTVLTDMVTAFENNSFIDIAYIDPDVRLNAQAMVLLIKKLKIDGLLNMLIPRSQSAKLIFNGQITYPNKEFENSNECTMTGHFKDNANPLDEASYNLVIELLRLSDSYFSQSQGALSMGGNRLTFNNAIIRNGSPPDGFSNPNAELNLIRCWLQPIDRSVEFSDVNSINAFWRIKQSGTWKDVIISTPVTFFKVPTFDGITLKNMGGILLLAINGLDRFGTSDEVPISGVDIIGSGTIQSIGSPRISLVNSAKGTATPISVIGAATQQQAGIPVYQDVQFHAVDINGNPMVDGTVIRQREKDNGKQTQFISYASQQNGGVFEYTKYDETTAINKTNTWTVAGGNGYTNTIRVRIGITWWNYIVNSNYNPNVSEGQVLDHKTNNANDEALFEGHAVGAELEPVLIQLRKKNATLVTTLTFVPKDVWEHTAAEIASFTEIDTYTKLFEAIRYYHQITPKVSEIIGIGNRLIEFGGKQLTAPSYGSGLVFRITNQYAENVFVERLPADEPENQVNVWINSHGIIITDDTFNDLVINGDLYFLDGYKINALYEYINASNKRITSHHIYPTTDVDVITHNNKQNIHIHAKSRSYTQLSNVTIIGKNGNEIVMSGSFSSASISVGDVVSSTNSTNNKGIAITEVGTDININSFKVEDSSIFNVGDEIYVSTESDITNVNLLELEDKVGQISHYFAYEKVGYYEIEIDIFGDVKRSISTYAELTDQVTPTIEVIAGAERISEWRIARGNGITVSLTDTNITPSGDWSDASPEQLLWNIRETLTEWNKSHPSQAEKRYESDYFVTIGRAIKWLKSFSTLAGFYTVKTDIYDTFVYVDTDSAFMTVDIGVVTETSTLFALRIGNVKSGYTVGYLVNGVSTYKILGSTDVSTEGVAILVLNKSDTYQMRIRRKGSNEPLINVSSNVRAITALFYAIPNVIFDDTFQGDVNLLFDWDSTTKPLIFLENISGEIQRFIDAILTYNQLFPQGVIGKSLISTDHGYLNNILTLNYAVKVNSHVETKTYHEDAIYQALAIQSGYNADGSPTWAYLESAEIDAGNNERFKVTYTLDYNTHVSTEGTKAFLERAVGTLGVVLLLGSNTSHTVNSVTSVDVGRLDRHEALPSGTIIFIKGRPQGISYGVKYRLYHKIKDEINETLEVTVKDSIRITVQIQTIDLNGSIIEADDHITWGAHETLQGGFDDESKERLVQTVSNTETIIDESDEMKDVVYDIDGLINNLVTHSNRFETEWDKEIDILSRYLLLKSNEVYGDIIDVDGNTRIIEYSVFVSDGGVTHLSLTAIIRKVNDDGTLGEIIATEDVEYNDRVNQYAKFRFENIVLEEGRYFIGIHGELDNYHAVIYETVVDGRGYYTVTNATGETPVKTDGRELVSSLEVSAKYSLKDLLTLQDFIREEIEPIRKGYSNKSVYFDDLQGTNQVKQNEAKVVWTYEDDGITVYRKVKFLDASGSVVVLADAVALEEYT